MTKVSLWYSKEKKEFLVNDAGSFGYLNGKKVDLDFFFMCYPNINSRQVKMIMLIEDNLKNVIRSL